MRVSSIVRNLDSDLLPVADKQYAAIVRTNPKDDTISVLNLRLRETVRNPGGEHDLQLEERDRLFLFSDAGKVDIQQNAEGEGAKQSSRSQTPGTTGLNREDNNPETFTRDILFAPVLQRLKAQATPANPQQTIRISGPVRYPGEYPMPASRNLADAIFVAGGLKDSASLYQAEVARHTIDADGVGETTLLSVNLAEAMAGSSEVELQSRDTILIKSVPGFAKTRTIELKGEVRYPGEYTFRDGETLKDVIERAGGLTHNAFPEGAIFTREKLRQLEAQRLREAEERLQGDLLGVQLQGDSVGGRNAERVQQVEDLLEEVQNSRPVGRMVIDLAAEIGRASCRERV